MIRLMTIDDYEAVHQLWLDTPGMGLSETDDSREGIERYLRRNPTSCFVAEQEGEIAGVILSGHDGRRGMIHHAAVRLSRRGQGIGSALVERAMAALRDEGIHKAMLVVYKHNQIGNEFWERRGFAVREDLNYRNKFI